MNTKTIHKIGSFIVTMVIAIIIVFVFREHPLVSAILCPAVGFGLGMMRQ